MEGSGDRRRPTDMPVDKDVAPPDDRLLVRRARGGDPDAFMALVRQHDPRLRALAYRLTGDADAMHDVLQDAYLRAFRAVPTFGGRSSFATWLYRIVYNTAIDEQRRRAASRSVAFDDIEEPAAPDRERADRVDLARALETLPHDQRAAVLLVDAFGFSYDEAADVLGVAGGTIASRLNRARAALRSSLTLTPAEVRP